MQDEGTEPTGTEELQLNSDVSVPAQVRPLIQMGPVPSPKAAAGKVLVTENKSDAIYSCIYQECLLHSRVVHYINFVVCINYCSILISAHLKFGYQISRGQM